MGIGSTSNEELRQQKRDEASLPGASSLIDPLTAAYCSPLTAHFSLPYAASTTLV
jgi:hypothetical protein